MADRVVDTLVCPLGAMVDVRSPVDGPEQDNVHYKVHGREIAASVPIAGLAAFTRPAVSTEVAGDALRALDTPGEPDPEPLMERFDHYSDVVAGLDFDAKVQHLRFLYADQSGSPARVTLAFELQLALASELSLVLKQDYESMVTAMRSKLRPS